MLLFGEWEDVMFGIGRGTYVLVKVACPQGERLANRTLQRIVLRVWHFGLSFFVGTGCRRWRGSCFWSKDVHLRITSLRTHDLESQGLRKTWGSCRPRPMTSLILSRVTRANHHKLNPLPVRIRFPIPPARLQQDPKISLRRRSQASEGVSMFVFWWEQWSPAWCAVFDYTVPHICWGLCPVGTRTRNGGNVFKYHRCLVP